LKKTPSGNLVCCHFKIEWMDSIYWDYCSEVWDC